jgi:hypothetical protein
MIVMTDIELARLDAPQETGNQQMYQRWGWHKVGRVPGGPGTTHPVFDLYLITLRR